MKKALEQQPSEGARPNLDFAFWLARDSPVYANTALSKKARQRVREQEGSPAGCETPPPEWAAEPL